MTVERLPVPRLLVLAAALTLPGGCGPLVVGTAAVGATVVAQERSVGAALEDSVIQGDVARRLLEYDAEIFQRVDTEVVEGKVLLTGQVATPEDRIDATRIAWQAENVVEVINEVEIRDDRAVSDAATDTWITTQLRSRLLFDPDIRSINYTVDTVNRAVYLMGVAQSEEELDRVIGHARNIKYVQRVVSHVRIKPSVAVDDGTSG